MKIKKIELYLNECYSCRSKQFEPLHEWIISQGLPLKIYQVNRIPLKREWQNLARELGEKGIKAPFLCFEFEDSEYEKQFWNYENFERNLKMATNKDIEQIWKNIMVKQEETPAQDVKVIKTSKKARAKIKTKKTSIKKEDVITSEVE